MAIGETSEHDAAERKADHAQRVGQRRVGAQDAEVGLHRRQRHDIRPHADAADGAEHQRDAQADPGVSGVDRADVGASVCDCHGVSRLEFRDCGSTRTGLRERRLAKG